MASLDSYSIGWTEAAAANNSSLSSRTNHDLEGLGATPYLTAWGARFEGQSVGLDRLAQALPEIGATGACRIEGAALPPSQTVSRSVCASKRRT